MDFINNYFLEVKKIIDNIDKNEILSMIRLIKRVRETSGRMFILGVGGGVIFVPLLTYFVNKDFKINTGISSLAVVFVATASSATYILNGFSLNVNILYLVLGGILGGYIGSKITELVKRNRMLIY